MVPAVLHVITRENDYTSVGVVTVGHRGHRAAPVERLRGSRFGQYPHGAVSTTGSQIAPAPLGSCRGAVL